MKRVFEIAVLTIASLAGCAGGSHTTVESHPALDLLAQMRQSLADINPRIVRIHLLNLVSDPSRPGHRYAALATATTATPDELSDEVFGVFVVDSTLTRVERVIEAFPSGRLQDYTVLISFPAPDTLLVRGFGTVDSESAIRHAHVWRP